MPDPAPTPDQRQAFHDALVAAFPTYSELERMVGDSNLGVKLNAIASSQALDQAVFELVRWAKAHGEVPKLAQAAVAARRTNRALRRAATPFLQDAAGQAGPASDPAHLALQYDDFLAALAKRDWPQVLALLNGLDETDAVKLARESVTTALANAGTALRREDYAGVFQEARRLGGILPADLLPLLKRAAERVAERANAGMQTFPSENGGLTALTLVPATNAVLTGTPAGVIQSRDLANGHCTWEFRGHNSSVLALLITPDGRSLFSGGDDYRVNHWDLSDPIPTANSLKKTYSGPSRGVSAVALLSDNRLLAGSFDNYLRLWNIHADDPPTQTPNYGDSHVASIAPINEREVLVGGYLVTHWNFNTQPPTRKLLQQTRSPLVRSLAVTPNGEWAVSGDEGGMVRIWNLGSWELDRELAGHALKVNSIVVAPDGRLALSGSDDGTIRLWELGSGQELFRLTTESEGAVAALAIPPDGSRIVAGLRNGSLVVWPLSPGLLAPAP